MAQFLLVMSICVDEVKQGPRGHLRSAVSAISEYNGAGAVLFRVLFLGTCPCFIAINSPPE